MRLKELFSKEKVPSVKTYPDYAAALADCNNEGYEDKELCNIIAQKTLKYQLKLNEKPFNINAVHCYLTLVIQHILLQHQLSHISVTDFGGGCGAHYFETRRFINQDMLNWQVIETPEMVKAATDFNIGNANLTFHNTTNNAAGDLLYLSSSIQYVPDPYGTLETLISKKFPYILFNRMMLNKASEEDTIIVQESWLSANGPGSLEPNIKDRIIKYPHTTLSEKKLMRQLDTNYELQFKFEETSGNIDPNNSKITGGGFLFKLR